MYALIHTGKKRVGTTSTRCVSRPHLLWVWIWIWIRLSIWMHTLGATNRYLYSLFINLGSYYTSKLEIQECRHGCRLDADWFKANPGSLSCFKCKKRCFAGRSHVGLTSLAELGLEETVMSSWVGHVSPPGGAEVRSEHVERSAVSVSLLLLPASRRTNTGKHGMKNRFSEKSAKLLYKRTSWDTHQRHGGTFDLCLAALTDF